MQIIVPDASVLLKWVLPSGEEQHREPALHLRQQALDGTIALKVPSLWLYEVGNTLCRRFPEHAGKLLEALIAFELESGEFSQKWLHQAITLTTRYSVTFYDAAYHALALVEKGIFVTADDKYVRKAKRAGSILPLRDWS